MIFLKTDFSDLEFDTMKQRKSRSKQVLKPAYKQQLPISGAKYKDLINMMKLYQANRDFYEGLPVDKSVSDCIPEQPDEE